MIIPFSKHTESIQNLDSEMCNFLLHRILHIVGNSRKMELICIKMFFFVCVCVFYAIKYIETDIFPDRNNWKIQVRVHPDSQNCK